MELTHELITVELDCLRKNFLLERIEFVFPRKYLEWVGKYGHLRRPVVRKVGDQFEVITEWEFVEAAREIGKKEMEVIYLHDVTDFILLDLIAFEMMYKQMNEEHKYELITTLIEFLVARPGLKKQIEGKKMNDKVGGIIGNVDGETVKLYKTIGDNKRELFQDRNLSLRDKYNAAKKPMINKDTLDLKPDEPKPNSQPDPEPSPPVEFIKSEIKVNRRWFPILLPLRKSHPDGMMEYGAEYDSEDDEGRPIKVDINTTITNYPYLKNCGYPFEKLKTGLTLTPKKHDTATVEITEIES